MAKPIEIHLKGYNKTQSGFLKDWKTPECAFVGGLGSGKSWSLIRKLLAQHLYNQCASLLVAPTWADLYRIDTPEVQQACNEWGLTCAINTHGKGNIKFPHILVQGSKKPILLLSAEEPGRIAGFEVGVAALDEAARAKESKDDPLKDAFTQIRSRIRHRNAKLLQFNLASTPEGKLNALYRDFFQEESEDRKVYRGITTENPYLPDEYIQSLKESYSPELAKQYLEGYPIEYSSNRAHPNFNADNIIAEPKRVNRVYFMGCDFNVAPLCWVYGYRDGKDIYVVDEIVIEDNANVETAMALAHTKEWGKYKVEFYADPASRQRSTVGDSEINVMIKMAKAFNWSFNDKTAKSHPRVATRIGLLDAGICDSKGARHVFVSENCERLIDELQNTGRGTNGYAPGPHKDRGHILDALGYPYYELMHRPPVKMQAINLSII